MKSISTRLITRALIDLFGTISGKTHRVAMVAVMAAVAITASAHGQLNPMCPNDECQFATPIAGPGTWSLDDLTAATTSAIPALPPCNYIEAYRDIWFCWTATFNGTANVDVGPNTIVQNQVFLGCACPTAATPWIVCGNTSFDVQCGQSYLIRVGAEVYPDPNAQKFMRINQVEGEDCPPLPPQVCDDCCGAKPTFDDEFYTANYTGQVAVVTGNDLTNGPSGYAVMTIFNLLCSSPPPSPGGIWNPGNAGPPAQTNAFRYTRPDWTKADLGSVFGTTLDNQGNIYVAHSDIYGDLNGGLAGTCANTTTAIGGLPLSTSTSVYRIPAGSGIPQVFVNLPGGTTNASDPGLGNLNYDCEHDEFFISHFGDGRIYRVDPAGTILGWYDHATDVIGLGGAPDPSGPYTTHVLLGERIWAVQAHQGRLYYSVWGQNRNRFDPPPPLAVVGTTPNRVWSIGLGPGPGGNFIAGTRRQEVMPPVYPGNASAPAGSIVFSSPVSDISFSPACRMLVAERDMSVDNCTLAHVARALEYESNGLAWLPSNFRSGYGYQIGSDGPSSNIENTNSSGGCDYDMPDPNDCVAGRLWVTGDFLTISPTFAYGFTGVDPSTAFGYSTAFHVDYNSVPGGTSATSDKTTQGDVEIPCRAGAPPCLNVSNEKILCPVGAADPPGCYTYTFSITNKSGFSVKYVVAKLHPDPTSPITINPNVINLLIQDGSLLEDGETTTITLTICGGNPGDAFCIRLGLLTPDFVECCFEDVCIELPECDCGQMRDQQIVGISCPTPGLVSFTFNFTLDNLAPFAADWVLFIPFDDEQAIFAKDFFYLPPLLPGDSLPMSVQILGAQPGETFCFNVLLHNPDGPVGDCCCAFEKCITVPPCPPAARWPSDLNGDGVVDIDDLLAVIAAWGPCPAPCPPTCSADVTGDCIVDVNDLLSVISTWGPCL